MGKNMLIFLDSNIICADYKMKSPSFEVAQKVGTIVLGQIVCKKTNRSNFMIFYSFENS